MSSCHGKCTGFTCIYIYRYIYIYTDKPFQEMWPFLREAVRRRDYDLDQSIASKAEQQRLQKFVSQAYASDALTWQKVFGSHPPRQTLARLCRRFRVQVHVTEGQHNVRNAKEFTTEVHRISRWYRERRRADVSRRRKVLKGKTEGSHQGKRDCDEQKGARAFAALATALARRKHDDVERGSSSDFGCRPVLVGSAGSTQLCKI